MASTIIGVDSTGTESGIEKRNDSMSRSELSAGASVDTPLSPKGDVSISGLETQMAADGLAFARASLTRGPE